MQYAVGIDDDELELVARVLLVLFVVLKRDDNWIFWGEGRVVGKGACQQLMKISVDRV